VMARSPVDKAGDYDPEKPNHMIFWLDATIGVPAEYIHLKKAFASNTDPRHETWTMLNDKNYEDLLRIDDAVTVQFEGVSFLLQAFINEDDCLKAFEKNQDKHIFLIASGALGKEIVPKVIEKYRHIFTDPITNKPYTSVYIFCHHLEYHNWVLDYAEYVQIFTFDLDLLTRMTLDIAEYFIERGKRIRQDNDLNGALQRLHWAKKLCHQHDKMLQQIATDDLRPVKESRKMKEINNLIMEIEEILPKKSFDADSDDDEKVGEQ
jgi:hypothetical protein